MPARPHAPPVLAPPVALLRAMDSHGVDTADHAAVSAWFEDFRRWPLVERIRALTGQGDVIAPVFLPADDEVVSAVGRTPIMSRLGRFLYWVGDGRRLTPAGDLVLEHRPFEPAPAVSVHHDEDPHEAAVAVRVRATRAGHLSGVDLTFRLALGCGLVRRRDDTLEVTERGTAVADPQDADFLRIAAQVWRDTVDVLLDLGAVSAGATDDGVRTRWACHLDGGVADLLCVLAVGGSGMWASDLTEIALLDLLAVGKVQSLSDVRRALLSDVLAHSVAETVERLFLLGVMTWESRAIPEPERWRSDERTGSWLSLTPLGNWYLRPLLAQHGFEVRALGRHVRDPAADLLDAVAAWPPAVLATEVWLWALGREDAADELIAAAVAARTLERRRLAFAALDALGERAVEAVRTAVALPVLRPFAVGWLQERDAAPPGAPGAGAGPRGLLDELAVALVMHGPEAMCALHASEHGAGQRECELLEELWRVNDPYVVPVLEALRGHGDGTVAKAAGRALFKRRNVN